MLHQGAPPRLFRLGHLPQTIVHYNGPHSGAFHIRGRHSGRRYAFSRGDCCKYIPDEDLDIFRDQPAFEVFDDDVSHHDPVRLQAIAGAERLKEQILQELLAAMPGSAPSLAGRPGIAATAQRRGGRQLGTGFGAYLDCLLNCGDLLGCYGSARAAYDAIACNGELLAGWPGAPPPRERFPAVRSDAAVQRKRLGRCIWHRHPAKR